MYNILIVEDEEIEKFALKSMILDNIKNVQIVGEAKNGYEAIEIIDNKTIDLAFMDINIPGINGLEVVQYLRTKHPKSNVIIITAYDKFEMAHAAIKLRVDDYLLKPVRPSVLIESVEKHLNSLDDNKVISEYNQYILKLKEEIYNQSYIESIKIVKNYIDEVYQSVYYNNLISKSLELFGMGIIDVAKSMGVSAIDELNIELNKIIDSNIYNKKKYRLYNDLKKMIDIIFLDLDNKRENSEKSTKSIINYIEINIKKGVTLEDVANYSNRNVYYLSKLFKKEMGINFIDYLTNRKIEIAKEMLSDTDMTMKNISMELGYNEPNYFSKVFRKNVGITPSKYREEALKKK
ncbi:response regulator [Tissierella sp. MSJ-40]|uniref:Response regulator n=1 Tax=Tissierella simiarum TaxID=2841534 RepID=A0ABS6E3P2_9FIRM|nr:response regulator [Tissierella simiarum]MBU5437525.1 response regulator [Tissierella simiarum]